jgi:DNA-binding NarL/FixJ family response regulator
VRTVLVCVRTPVAAQTVAAAAARLGMTHAVRTAVTMVEALARLAEGPADLVLADPALSRPDTAEFARRILAAAPNATIVFFGSEEPRAAAAALAAGARAVLRVDTAEPVTTLAKAILLVLTQTGRNGDASAMRGAAPSQQNGDGHPRPATRDAALAAREPARAALGARIPTTPVPQQRGDVPAEPPRRRVDLTERELQVLRGMADGKSNAEIGRELFVSEDTVKTHARRLFRKLGARDRAHAVAAAFRAGLVS